MKMTVTQNVEAKIISDGEHRSIEVDVKTVSFSEPKTFTVNDEQNTESLYDQYKHDEKVNGLVMQMAGLYEKFGLPVQVGTDAVKSVLPPDIQAKWEALSQELQDYKHQMYPSLEDEEAWGQD